MQKNLFRIFVVGFSVFLVFSSQAKAQNADIVLDSSNGTSAFQIKNSNRFNRNKGGRLWTRF